MGVSASIGLLHLWMARRAWDENVWVAAWSALACVFLCARGVHLTTDDPIAAEYAGKTSYVVGPFLVWALVGFGRTINRRPVRRASLVLAAIGVVWAALIYPTHWFVVPVTTTFASESSRRTVAASIGKSSSASSGVTLSDSTVTATVPAVETFTARTLGVKRTRLTPGA